MAVNDCLEVCLASWRIVVQSLQENPRSTKGVFRTQSNIQDGAFLKIYNYFRKSCILGV